jgi:hypothetical protein
VFPLPVLNNAHQKVNYAYIAQLITVILKVDKAVDKHFSFLKRLRLFCLGVGLGDNNLQKINILLRHEIPKRFEGYFVG